LYFFGTSSFLTGVAPEYIGIQEEQLRSWQLLERFRRELLPRLKARPASELSASEQDPRRTLVAEDYFSSFLFCIFNPVVTSMRERDLREVGVSATVTDREGHVRDPPDPGGARAAAVHLSQLDGDSWQRAGHRRHWDACEP
jgi:hypothetical protein